MPTAFSAPHLDKDAKMGVIGWGNGFYANFSNNSVMAFVCFTDKFKEFVVFAKFYASCFLMRFILLKNVVRFLRAVCDLKG